MKILLDESLPRKLKTQFESEHEVWTVRDMGWLGKKNGSLIKLLIAGSFDLFITVDRNLRYQQNIESLPFTIVVLCAKNNRLKTLVELIPKVFERLEQDNLQRVIEVS